MFCDREKKLFIILLNNYNSKSIQKAGENKQMQQAG
jgi:hypothetical protein